jgi:hypothetical protein
MTLEIRKLTFIFTTLNSRRIIKIRARLHRKERLRISHEAVLSYLIMNFVGQPLSLRILDSRIGIVGPETGLPDITLQCPK